MSQIPLTVDRFDIVRILGRGGMGTVYLARDQRLGREVAIKVLNLEDLSSEESRARFLREARTAAGIRHQNVATIYEVGETPEGQPFIVMEYCEGETLTQRLRTRPFTTSEFLNVARQMAAGLAAAHASGVVHRDIKSGNIMLEPNGLVKILDFGLAKIVAREAGNEKESFLSTSGQFFGTLHYLAPEQTRGSQANERSDLFSAGVVLYQMATGKLPFNADGPLLVLEKIREGEPEPFVPLDPTFPPAVIRIISRLLQKNPADRFHTAEELLRALQEIEPPTASFTSKHAHSMLGRTKPRPRGLRLAIVVGALALVAASVYTVRRQTPASPAPAQTSTAAVTPIRSMAVLPLNNIAKNKSDDFLSIGLADALVTKLQAIPSLRVRPTSAVLEFHDTKDAKLASDKLQVDGILEGHFLAAGDLVRVNLQLTDSRTGYSVWADTIDGKRDDLLKLIDDVSERTVEALNAKLGVAQVAAHSQPRSVSPAAYEQYLRARALTGSFVQEDFDAQVKALETAVKLDPNFAAAYADLAIALSLGHTRSLATADDTLPRALGYARHAVRLDPNLPQAHLALGRVFVRFPDRYTESAREVLAALRLNASDTIALHSVVTYFVSAGDFQKGQCVADRLTALDPSSNESKTRGYWYVNAVDPEGAIKNAQWALDSKDTQVAGHDIRGLAFLMQGDLASAEKEAEALAELAPRHYLGKSIRAMIASARGDRKTAEAELRAFEPDAIRGHWAAIRAALCYAKLGDRAKAIQWLKHSALLGHHSWYALVKHPWFQDLQSDPEFQKITAQMRSDLDDVRDDMIGVQQLICR